MSNPCLYMFVATHLESMNMGKAMAQACHCANQFIEEWFIDQDDTDADMLSLICDWKGDRGFGTQVCLTTEDFKRTYEELHDKFEYDDCALIGPTYDPTYPFEVTKELLPYLKPEIAATALIRGNTVICTRNEFTAFYVFGDRENPDFATVMRKFKRHG